mgnify:CR=1 FL=1
MEIYNKPLDLDGLLTFEKENFQNNFFQVKVYKEDIKTVKFFLDNEYEITQIEGEFYFLKKENTEKKSFRISLTENCNYKCFFCHEEGMEMGEKRTGEKEYEEIEKIAKRFKLSVSKYFRFLITEKELRINEFKEDETLLSYGNNFIRIKNLLRHREFSQLDHTKVILREVEIVTKLIYDYLYNKMNSRTEVDFQEDE